MKLSRYPDYKDSGVDWLGPVPRHWDVKRLKKLAIQVTGKATERQRPVGLENIEGWSGRFISTDAEFQGEGVAFSAGDILFGKLRPYLAKVYLADFCGEAVGDFHVVRPLQKIKGRYLQYAMLTRSFIDIVDGSTFGSKMPRASWEALGGMSMVVPPPEEQCSIAAFLDRETSKIDALIAEQERLLELLAEKRQAVISHAVTKGLNPDAPMKDSGVAWLGDVPAHWVMKPLGHLCTAISYGFTNPMPTTDEGPYLLTANDIAMGNIRYESARRTSWESFSLELTDKSRPRAGDILITKDGTLGRVALFDGSDACINQSVASLRTDHQVMDPKFLSVALSGGAYQERMVTDSGGTTIKHIYISRLAKMPIAVPPVDEQRAIFDLVMTRTESLDRLVAMSARAIALLSERRSALVSAAVTGQIDVREAA